MKDVKLNIALFSPNKNPYSETFIQAHKNLLNGNVFYYYGKSNNVQLEGSKRIVSKLKTNQLKIANKISKRPSGFINEQTLLNSFKAHKIDVIFVEYGTHSYKLRHVLITSGLPIVTIFHGFDASIHEVVNRCNNYKEVFNLSNKVVAVSKKMASMLENLGCDKNKIVHTPCAPNDDFYNLEPNFLKPQFLSVGRFVDKKAPYYVVLAFKEVIKKHPDASLIMVGDGHLFEMVKNLISFYKLENSIKLLGAVTPEKCKELMNESHAFVQHSITALNGNMEGTPVSVLEASIAGLPVISTCHAGIPDVIIHEKTGLLCDEHDVESMALNMCQLLDDIEYAKTLGRNGKEFIKNNFSMSSHIKILDEALFEAVKSYK